MEKVLCVKTPMCLYLCAQKHLCTKHLCVNTSFFAEKTLCVKASVYKIFFCAQTSLCKKMRVRAALCKGFCA